MPQATDLVYFSFVGLQARTTALHQRVVTLATQQFTNEKVDDFGDPLEGWEGMRIDGERKRDKPPVERLGYRGTMLIGRLRRRVVPKVEAGATLGFFRRLGADTWIGSNGHTLDQVDLKTLELWEAFVRAGIQGLGLPTPSCYFHTDGDDLLEHLLGIYCGHLRQRYVKIDPELDIDAQADEILDHVEKVLADHHREHSAAA
jgi:hypothetical protein